MNLDQSLPFCLVRSVTHFKCWLELRAWIVRSAWRNRVGKIGWVRRPLVCGRTWCVFLLAGVCSSSSPAAVSIHLQVGGFTQSVVSISARVLHLVVCHVI